MLSRHHHPRTTHSGTAVADASTTTRTRRRLSRPGGLTQTAANPRPLNRRRWQFAYRYLGPVFNEFCHRLYLHQQAFADRSACALYMARGGMRLRAVFNEFLQRHHLPAPLDQQDFMASRYMACKATADILPEQVAATFETEFRGQCVRDMAQALLPAGVVRDAAVALNTLPPELAEASPVTAEHYWALRRPSTGEYADLLNRHLADQASLYREYLDRQFGQYDDLVVVDTGWYGSILAMLMKAFPRWTWWGAHFGRWSYGRPAPPHFARITGLCFEAAKRDPGRLETVFCEYHHLIESPMEPRLPSVEYMERDGRGGVASNLENATDWRQRVTDRDDDFFSGILAYVAEGPCQGRATVARRQCHAALRTLRRKILFPSRRDVEVMLVGDRGFDFGKPGAWGVMRGKHRAASIREGCNQTCHALWQPGQAVLSFSRWFAPIVQCVLYLRPWLRKWLRR